MNSIFSSKFIITIKTWSEEELKSFEAWLKSPWCNTNKNLIKLFERLKRYYPTFEDRKLNKEKLFQQVLPTGKFSVRRMNNLLSEGYLAAERFLIFQNLSNDQSLQRDLLTKEFQNRHLEDWFFKNVNQDIDKLEKKKVKSWEDHLALLRLNQRIYHHPNQNPRIQLGAPTIVKMGDQIDLIYLLEKALIINEKITRNRILKDENHEVSIELKKWRIASEGIKLPAIDLYKMRFDYHENSNLEQYLQLRAAFLDCYKELNEKEQKIHFFSLLNDTTVLIRRKSLDISDSLPLYKLGLKTDILLHQGVLSHAMYVTIISGSNHIKDFDFTNHMIETYTPKLDRLFQTDAFHWAIAHMAYRQTKLSESLDILLSHEFKARYFQLITKILTTQVYFDLFLDDDSYQSYLLNYFDSFEKSILREKFRSDFTKKSYLRFVQVCRIIAKSFIDVNYNSSRIENLLEHEANIQAPRWLKKRIELVMKTKGRRPSEN